MRNRSLSTYAFIAALAVAPACSGKHGKSSDGGVPDGSTSQDGSASVDGSMSGDLAMPADAAVDAAVDASMHVDAGVDLAVGAHCGDGTLDPGEQCDDGNRFDLDGCDSSCKYEVVARMTAFALSGNAAPAALGCTPATNALGTQAITTGGALGQFNGQLQTQINNGTANTTMQFIGLSDLTGLNATGFQIGVVGASRDPARGAWPGSNPIDWWFLADPTDISMGLPKSLLANATLANGTLTAGPSNLTFTTVLFDSSVITLLDARIVGAVGTTTDEPAPPPAQLASDVAVFETITADGSHQGLCGNLTVASLAAIPAPQALTTANTSGMACAACTGSHTYTYCGAGQPVGASCNSLLDVIVGGCGAFPQSNGACLLSGVTATGPDVPANATVMKLSVGGMYNKVTQNVTTDMDAYSTYFTFAANRAHFTGETCTGTGECQVGKTCTNGVCM